MKRPGLPVLLGLAHGASDAAAGFLITQVLVLNLLPAVDYILIYNALAFGLQPAAGLVLDTYKVPRSAVILGLFLSALSLLLTRFDMAWGILAAGLGSAIFHTGGGSMALTSTPGRAAGPGVFTAFGVIGLALGSQLAINISSSTPAPLILSIVILAGLIWFFPASKTTPSCAHPTITGKTIEITAFALVLAVTLRSVVWMNVQSDAPGYSQLAQFIALAAGSGKLCGGFLADKFGWQRFAVTAVLTSAFLLAFRANMLWLVLAGVFFLQSVTPLTLAALGRIMPNSPALAASLVLGTGVLLGSLPMMFIHTNWLAGPLGITLILFTSGGLYFLTLRGLKGSEIQL
jgi:FSR family fosmidomycin resistance protein-like MFS transporter